MQLKMTSIENETNVEEKEVNKQSSNPSRNLEKEIMVVADLKSNTYYCTSENDLNPERITITDDFNTETKPHYLILRLLHIFGPYEDSKFKCNNLILIAQCLNDDDHNVLICVKLLDQQQHNITFDNINQIFTLENFLTIKCPPKIVFESTEIQCHVFTKPLYEIVLIVSTEFNSVIKFYGNYVDNDNILPDDPITIDNVLDGKHISENEAIDACSEEENYLTDDDYEEVLTRVSKDSSLKARNDIDLKKNSINEIVDKIQSETLLEFDVNKLIQANIDLISNEEAISITNLSDLHYPSNTLQSVILVNVVGLIVSITIDKDLLIIDRTINDIPVRIKLDHNGLEYYTKSKSTQSLITNQNTRSYPCFKPGDIVCIRNLCLNFNGKNICPHPDQVIVIEPHLDNYRLADQVLTRLINQSELIRSINLIEQLQVPRLLEGKSKSTNNVVMMDLVGQILAKRALNFSKRLEIFLMVPQKLTKACHIEDNLFFILDQIENMSFHSTRKYFNEIFLRKLKLNNQIIVISVYENHIECFKNLLPLDYVAFYNVHIRNDRFFKGFSHYIMHSGTDFGRRCVHIHKNSILGEHLTNEFARYYEINDPLVETFVDDFLANLDDSVRSKLGPESRSIIRSLQDNEKDLMNYENSAQFVASMLAKKNPFNYFRSDKHLFESNVNVAAAKTIEKFSDLFLETEIRRTIFLIMVTINTMCQKIIINLSMVIGLCFESLPI
ncbi:hypothetical protein SSS_02578 [Sarcoptes scabiei]|nr:hypothetical protein SSS_02578 [Sarcoptes scabiei]